MNLNDPGAWVKQDLGTTVNAGDTLAVMFSAMGGDQFTTKAGMIDVSFLIGSTEYSQTFDLTSTHAVNTWGALTLTKIIGVSGNLSVIFRNHYVEGDRLPYNWGPGNISRAWLDNVSDVSVTHP